MKKHQKGFTLIELLVVIAIIGLLATLAIVSLRGAQQQARDTKRVTDTKSIQTSLELYASENNNAYPIGLANWDALETALAPYITNLPSDPTNDGTSRYIYGSNGTEYVVSALLEDTNHQALDQDSNATEGGAGWQWEVSSGNAIADDATLDCSVAGRYCLVE